MYAVIDTDGKQYRVEEGQSLRLDKRELEIGAKVEFDKVLLVSKEGSLSVGAPHVANSKVIAEVVNHGRAKKIKIIKFKRRKHQMKRQGHRQWFTEVKIKAIEAA